MRGTVALSRLQGGDPDSGCMKPLHPQGLWGQIQERAHGDLGHHWHGRAPGRGQPGQTGGSAPTAPLTRPDLWTLPASLPSVPGSCP